MIVDKANAYHKAVMIRVLWHILAERVLKESLGFKGGSCAAFLGWLDRFSVDLDFDLLARDKKEVVVRELEKVFRKLNLAVKKKAKESLFYIVGYESPEEYRKNLKISVVEEVPQANQYRPFFIDEIKKFVYCQTKETMLANKLVAVKERYEKYGAIAGRDIYDIYYLLSRNGGVEGAVIEERTGVGVKEYMRWLADFIEEKVSQKVIDEDLNYLLAPERFRALRQTLKREVVVLLREWEMESGVVAE